MVVVVSLNLAQLLFYPDLMKNFVVYFFLADVRGRRGAAGFGEPV